MEFNREQIREFNKKGFTSVAARIARDTEKLLVEQEDLTSDMQSRLNEARSYLMGIQPSEISIEDALEALGFGRNGLRN